jgi:hypothetical protein
VLVEVGAARGVLAVPFESALLVRALVSDARGELVALAGASLEVELTGAELLAPAAPTDARGRSRLPVRPEEHSVSLRLRVRGDGREGGWYGALPVRPGALLGTRDGAQLIVRSPIPRAQAYVSWITRRERVAGALVPLAEDPDGTSSGRLALDPATLSRLDAEPSWAVVSSEYDKRSAGAVGWPFGVAVDPDAPPTTLDAGDLVLCDGRARALERAHQRTGLRRRDAGAALLGVGGLMSALFWAEVRGRRGRRHERGPASDSEETLAPGAVTGSGLLVVALLCIALGVGALAYFGLLAR